MNGFEGLKVVKLDEIELYLNQLVKDYGEELKNITYLEISKLIQSNFGVMCTEHQINLLYDPDLAQEEYDVQEYHERVLDLIKMIDNQ